MTKEGQSEGLKIQTAGPEENQNSTIMNWGSVAGIRKLNSWL